MKGGLAQVSIALATLMGGVSGSAIADAAMQARMLGTEMLKRGFPRGYAAGVLSYGSLMTPIIPPGIGFILYGTVGQVSIGRLFAAGFVPVPPALGGARAHDLDHRAKEGYEPERKTRPTVKEVGKAMWGGCGRCSSRCSCCSACASAFLRPPRSARSPWCMRLVIGMFAYRAQARLAQGGARGQLHRRRLGHAAARAVRSVRLRHRLRARA